MKIEAILFDLGKVLIDFDMNTAVERMLSSCSASRDCFEKALWDKRWIRRYECGEISTRDFHEYLCNKAGLQVNLTEFLNIWSSVFLPDLMVSEKLLAVLQRSYPLILISNTNDAHVEYLRNAYRVFDYFDHLIFSHEVGSLKPDPKIFQHAIAATGKPPGALFFTDDREENILAARDLGIHAHQFRTESGLVAALRDAGVEVEQTQT